MNVFNTIFGGILANEHANDTRLGVPSRDAAQCVRRLTAMEDMAGGKGFRKERKLLETDRQGRTRGDLKRGRRRAMWAKVMSEQETRASRLTVFGWPRAAIIKGFGSVYV